MAYVLQNYPDTRDSDTSLALRYWLRWQAERLEKEGIPDLDILYDLEKVETITRARRLIQNRYELFRGQPRIHAARDVKQRELNQILAAASSGAPEMRFYLDETSNDTKDNYVGIAGICILNWAQYEISHAALTQWRERQGWPETIHFADLDASTRARAIALIMQMSSPKRRAGLLFFAYRLNARGATSNKIASLIQQLVVDALKEADSHGCIDTRRGIRIVKEAETGFDTFHIPELEKTIAVQLAREFPDRVYLVGIESRAKGREVLLEVADLIAASTRRRDLFASQNPKDVLAQTVMNLTGFEDTRDDRVLFKLFPLDRSGR